MEGVSTGATLERMAKQAARPRRARHHEAGDSLEVLARLLLGPRVGRRVPAPAAAACRRLEHGSRRTVRCPRASPGRAARPARDTPRNSTARPRAAGPIRHRRIESVRPDVKRVRPAVLARERAYARTGQPRQSRESSTPPQAEQSGSEYTLHADDETRLRGGGVYGGLRLRCCFLCWGDSDRPFRMIRETQSSMPGSCGTARGPCP